MATFTGNIFNNTFTGTSGDDDFDLFAGQDSADGGAGNDILFGGSGDDDLEGGADNDTLYGGAGYDFLYGGDGNDTLFGDDDSFEDFFGGAGEDTIYAGNSDNNWIYGGDDNDEIYAGEGAESIQGDGGDDSIYAGSGADTVLGGDGNDLIQGQQGNDSLYGGDGSDSFEFIDTSGLDTIFGGADTDTLSYLGASALTVNFSATATGTYSAGASSGVFEGIEQVEGGSGNDSMLGGIGGETLFGNSGDDTIDASGGSDRIFGGDGNDSIEGGEGYDVIYYGEGDNTVYGGNDADIIDDVAGGTQSGNDLIYAGAGDDQVFTGDANDTIFGGTGNDVIAGESGNDTLFGGTGNDQLSGQAGNDSMYGGDGNDTLTLGAGNDSAGFSRFGGADVVTDFDIGDVDSDGFYNDQLDVSQLRTLGGDPVTTGDVTPVDVGGGNVRLDFPEGESITLQGVSFAQMSSPAQLRAAGIPCFTAGTRIATPKGAVPVETLKPGDKVLTRDNGFQPIKWVGSRALAADAMKANPKMRPVRFAPGVFANTEPVLFSQQHGVLMRDARAGTEYLVRAVHLAKLKGGAVRIAEGIKSITYVHLLFDTHQIVLSGGIWSESFYPGPWALRSLDLPQMQELATLFPKLFLSNVCETYGDPARRFPAFANLQGRAEVSQISVRGLVGSIPSWQG